MLQPLADGQQKLQVTGTSVRELVKNITVQYPELGTRLVGQGKLRANLSVAIDGEISTLGLIDEVAEDSEVHFVPAIAGGRL